jgi:hypothetical protein
MALPIAIVSQGSCRHAGSGWSLSFGCALEAAVLVNDIVLEIEQDRPKASNKWVETD